MGAGSKEDREALIAEASLWLAKLDNGSTDIEALERWRSASPARAAAFAEVAAAWESLATLRTAPPAARRAPRRSATGADRRWFLRAAGLGAVTLLGAGLFAGGRAVARTHVEAGIGERRAVAMPDGTSLDLNTDSAISWRVGRKRSYVWLERGQVALSVPRSNSREVLLCARGSEASVAAGRFDARLRGDSVELTVLSGRAATAAGTISADVAGPAHLTLTGDVVRRRPISTAELNETTSWWRGEIVFDGEALAGVVDEYNRYLTRKLVIDDPAIAGLRLGGRFRTNDVDGFLQALNQSFGVEARAFDGRIHLTSGKKAPTG